MSATNSTAMATLEEAGFTFPECFGPSRHPFLDDNGQPRDPRTIGFGPCTIGGGTPALCLETGRFRIFLLDDGGSGVPDFEEWAEALISIDVDASEPSGYDLLCVTGQEWERICS